MIWVIENSFTYVCTLHYNLSYIYAHPDHNQPSTTSIPLQFTAETLAIAVASATIGALILGFITGFFCGKKCNKDEDNQLYADTDYEYFDQRQNPNRLVIS